MGTNYYMEIDTCYCCGRAKESLHIGKSSFGWAFGLNTHPENGINNLADWQATWGDKVIKDEYGDTISAEAMEAKILVRPLAGGKSLARHEVDGRFCISHGEGSYDILRGDFS